MRRRYRRPDPQTRKPADANMLDDGYQYEWLPAEHVTLRTCKHGILNDDFGTKHNWLVQQENCARSNPHGLSLAIRNKYSYGCVLHLPTTHKRVVIVAGGMHVQVAAGPMVRPAALLARGSHDHLGRRIDDHLSARRLHSGS